MTYSVVPALRAAPGAGRRVGAPAHLARSTTPRPDRPAGKPGALAGMAMTEKQGGSDVRANTTAAVAAGGGRRYPLTGHKWFCSAPMCDLFLVLAQAPGGLSCFAVAPLDARRRAQRFFIQRLKDKLGNRSNASSEIELDGAWARLVGEEGRGVPTIIEMVNHTRLDCVIGAAAGMRQALAQAAHHAAHRQAFGKRPDRPAADGASAGRPRRRVRGGHGHHAAAGPAPTTGPAGRRPRGGVSPAGHGGREVLGVQARTAHGRPRRSSASAATATSRSRSCPGCSGRARLTASGKGRAT